MRVLLIEQVSRSFLPSAIMIGKSFLFLRKTDHLSLSPFASFSCFLWHIHFSLVYSSLLPTFLALVLLPFFFYIPVEAC